MINYSTFQFNIIYREESDVVNDHGYKRVVSEISTNEPAEEDVDKNAPEEKFNVNEVLIVSNMETDENTPEYVLKVIRH